MLLKTDDSGVLMERSLSFVNLAVVPFQGQKLFLFNIVTRRITLPPATRNTFLYTYGTVTPTTQG